MIALGSRRRAQAVPARRASRKPEKSNANMFKRDLTEDTGGKGDTHEGQGDAHHKRQIWGEPRRNSRVRTRKLRAGEKSNSRYRHEPPPHTRARARALRLACERRPNSDCARHALGANWVTFATTASLQAMRPAAGAARRP